MIHAWGGFKEDSHIVSTCTPNGISSGHKELQIDDQEGVDGSFSKVFNKAVCYYSILFSG